ncbi:MAG: hypothetical protein A2Y10_00955 [Planctomycetes bacterium GWF2_41_51]|nr:MAG: hypothetical protein A2Y10_00955 [Planctomycetes bacterium GWF2_41_51]HBG26513.1 ferritin [Phycisphaerales bacterium]
MTEEIYEKLSSLIQLDIDAANAYDQAIEKCDDALVREHLETYKEDHQRHIDELSAYLTDYDMEPPEEKPDFKGVLIEGFTAMRSVTGTEGALKAMRTNEKLTNKKYNEAMDWDVDLDAKDIIMRGYEDEKTHLIYIEEQLSVRTR